MVEQKEYLFARATALVLITFCVSFILPYVLAQKFFNNVEAQKPQTYSSFSSLRAQTYLEDILKQGESYEVARISPSEELDYAFTYIQDFADELALFTDPSLTIRVTEIVPDDDFYFLTSFYSQPSAMTKSLAVQVYPTAAPNLPSVAFVSHLDTAPLSPGAAASTAWVAAMLETMNVVASTPSIFETHSVAFVFEHERTQNLGGAQLVNTYFSPIRSAQHVALLSASGAHCSPTLIGVHSAGDRRWYSRATRGLSSSHKVARTSALWGAGGRSPLLAASGAELYDLNNAYGVELAFLGNGAAAATDVDAGTLATRGMLQTAGDLLVALAAEPPVDAAATDTGYIFAVFPGFAAFFTTVGAVGVQAILVLVVILVLGVFLFHPRLTPQKQAGPHKRWLLALEACLAAPLVAAAAVGVAALVELVTVQLGEGSAIFRQEYTMWLVFAVPVVAAVEVLTQVLFGLFVRVSGTFSVQPTQRLCDFVALCCGAVLGSQLLGIAFFRFGFTLSMSAVPFGAFLCMLFVVALFALAVAFAPPPRNDNFFNLSLYSFARAITTKPGLALAVGFAFVALVLQVFVAFPAVNDAVALFLAVKAGASSGDDAYGGLLLIVPLVFSFYFPSVALVHAGFLMAETHNSQLIAVQVSPGAGGFAITASASSSTSVVVSVSTSDIVDARVYPESYSSSRTTDAASKAPDSSTRDLSGSTASAGTRGARRAKAVALLTDHACSLLVAVGVVAVLLVSLCSSMFLARPYGTDTRDGTLNASFLKARLTLVIDRTQFSGAPDTPVLTLASDASATHVSAALALLDPADVVASEATGRVLSLAPQDGYALALTDEAVTFSELDGGTLAAAATARIEATAVDGATYHTVTVSVSSAAAPAAANRRFRVIFYSAEHDFFLQPEALRDEKSGTDRFTNPHFRAALAGEVALAAQPFAGGFAVEMFGDAASDAEFELTISDVAKPSLVVMLDTAVRRGAAPSSWILARERVRPHFQAVSAGDDMFPAFVREELVVNEV
eukprot:gnl/Chilomastix_cuspidata/281.p1 GENE.gnl/Chilomastix_cuspidata/281~~gnl/Chilomastix_cuspidata/281.p1  ORF type:complete len:1016 (+),score=394.62 gnl/Chilomastix_cuspidata/281:523-3570(+)